MSILVKNEKVLAEAKRHPFYFYTQISGLIITAVIPYFIYVIFIKSLLDIEIAHAHLFFLFPYLLFLIVIWIFIFVSWTDYFVDSWTITDSRVIDFELKGLFHKDIASVTLDNIEDVKVVSVGVIEHWLKIGNIHLQTAGSSSEFTIRGVRNPDEIKASIFEAIANFKHAHKHTEPTEK